VDLYAVLKADHDQIRELLAALDKVCRAGRRGRGKPFLALRRFVEAHARAEEAVLYAALKRHAATGHDVREGYVEHDIASALMDRMAHTRSTHPDWYPCFDVLKEGLEHHLREEERALFKKARRMFSAEAAERLGARMRARRLALTNGAA
jgi:hemerythrin-like domain-containing protein